MHKIYVYVANGYLHRDPAQPSYFLVKKEDVSTDRFGEYDWQIEMWHMIPYPAKLGTYTVHEQYVKKLDC
jgi:hypothetical protein